MIIVTIIAHHIHCHILHYLLSENRARRKQRMLRSVGIMVFHNTTEVLPPASLVSIRQEKLGFLFDEFQLKFELEIVRSLIELLSHANSFRKQDVIILIFSLNKV